MTSALIPALATAPASSVDQVISIMTAIREALPDTDGVKWFNHLYLHVTLAVAGRLGAQTWKDPGWLGELDVAFANLYFEALKKGDQQVSDAPSAWRPLFESRSRSMLARVQFALAGMNAHINRDLPVALEQTCLAHGDGFPSRTHGRYADFVAVNDLLAAVEEEVKKDFQGKTLGAIDVALGRLDDVTEMWSVRLARENAWINGEVLWHLRPAGSLHDAHLKGLDRLAGALGRGLLIPLR